MCKRIKLDPYLPPYTVNSKWIEDLNTGPETIGLLGENIGEKFHNIGLGNEFLGMTPKAQSTKEKIDKWVYIKPKSCCAAKETINKKAALQKKFVSHIYDHLPGGASGKEPACQCRRHKRCASIPGSGRFPRRRAWQPLQRSCLENPMDRGAWRATVHGVTKSQTWLTLLST